MLDKKQMSAKVLGESPASEMSIKEISVWGADVLTLLSIFKSIVDTN